MEVHHHPHVPNNPKPWKEYLIEGLMIFVAVTLGYGAENVREHYINKHKGIISVQNLYKDLKDDSLSYKNSIKNRSFQDSCFEVISNLFDENKIKNEIPTVYAAHSSISLRMIPSMNTMALDQIKSSGALNYIEDDELKEMIQSYSSDANGLKLREQREFSFIDRMLDPISTTRFEYKYYQKIGDSSFRILNNKIIINYATPAKLKIVKENTFDWDNYLSILGMLKTIRKSTDKSYIIPTQAKCNKLIDLVRKYLKENNSLIEQNL
jgi:hypothetical protein